LEYALTDIVPVTPLECAVTKKGEGVGSSSVVRYESHDKVETIAELVLVMMEMPTRSEENP
jgi:hypothetical protein